MVDGKAVEMELRRRGKGAMADIAFGDGWSPATIRLIWEADTIVMNAKGVDEAADLVETAFNQEALAGGFAS